MTADPDVSGLTDSEDEPSTAEPDVPTVPIPRESIPRYVAASIDNVFEMVAIVFAVKSMPPSWKLMQFPMILVAYLGYYLFFEGLFGRTPGKFMMGLIVVRYDGSRCTWRQAWIRTLTRLLEVNPLLLGAIPAALLIVTTRYHQRFGDKLAETLVVPVRSLE